ncbi:NYN domain-containing protein [Acidobacteriota bacterium]
MSNKRLMIFIDGSNVYRESKRYFGDDYQVDYLKLIEQLRGDFDLIRTYFYGSTKIGDDSFYESLQYKGIKTTKKPLKRRGNSHIEKGVDVALATDVLSLGFRSAYDVAFIVSGDGDFISVIELIQWLGKIVHVSFFENSMAKTLKLMADSVVYLDGWQEKIRFEGASTENE